MSPSRILVILGVVGGFAAGTGLALYLSGGFGGGGGGAGAAQTSATGATSAGVVGTSAAAQSAVASEGAEGPVLKGPELVDRFWQCMTIPDEAERQRTWLGLLKTLTKEDAAEVRQLFKKMDRQGRWMVPEWDAFWPRWAQIDGAAAMASVEQNEGEEWKPYFAEKILRGWAQGDPDGALQWLREHRESPMYGNGIRSYVDGLAKLDLDRATKFVLGETPEDSKGHLGKFMEALTERALQQRMVGGMANWFADLPESPAKTAAVDAVAFRLFRAEPARAMEWVAQQVDKPWRSDRAISDTADKVAQGDPQKALDWVTKLPPSSATGRYNGLSKTVQSLAAKDPEAVITWLAQPQLDAAMRDQGTAAYAMHLLKTGSPAAQEWLEKVTDTRLFSSDSMGAGMAGRTGTMLINGRAVRFEPGKAPVILDRGTLQPQEKPGR